MVARAHVAQWRLTGPTAGLRILRAVRGPQKWRMQLWLIKADRTREEHEISVSAPVDLRALTQQAQASIDELCAGCPTVYQAGWDAWTVRQ